MIDTDDTRDHAEERANLADMRREQEAEAAHERLVARIVEALREQSTEAARNAGETLDRIGEELSHRIGVNAHRYELLARQQYTAHLASALAVAIEASGSYDLLGAAENAARAYKATHYTERGGDLTDRALSLAAAHVVGRVRSFVEDEERAEIGAREQADLDETHRSLR